MNPAAETEQPLVSIIVRSMGRALLCDAVESIFAQDYTPIEVVIVDRPLSDPVRPRRRWKQFAMTPVLFKSAAQEPQSCSTRF